MKSVPVKMIRFAPGVLESVEDAIVASRSIALAYFPAAQMVQITYLGQKDRDPLAVPAANVLRMAFVEPLASTPDDEPKKPSGLDANRAK